MTDFQSLPLNYQASLQAKLDGYLEASIHLARAHNIGLSEALELTVRALLREMIAYKIDPQRPNQIWSLATSELFRPPEREKSLRFNRAHQLPDADRRSSPSLATGLI